MEAQGGHRHHCFRVLRRMDAFDAAINVPGASGLWRVAPMPTYDGQPTNAESGGSALAVLQLTRKPDAAYRFVDFVTHDAQGISARVAGGAFLPTMTPSIPVNSSIRPRSRTIVASKFRISAGRNSTVCFPKRPRTYPWDISICRLKCMHVTISRAR